MQHLCHCLEVGHGRKPAWQNIAIFANELTNCTSECIVTILYQKCTTWVFTMLYIKQDNIYRMHITELQITHILLTIISLSLLFSSRILRAFGSVSPGGRSSPCHLRSSASAIRQDETHWTPKNHLAQNDRWGHPAPELWGPPSMEES